MCVKTPKMTAPAAPPAPPDTQDQKTVGDINAVRRKQAGGTTPIAGGTLLTGPSGVQNSMLNVGGSTLLGG